MRSTTKLALILSIALAGPVALATSLPVGPDTYERYEWRASTFSFSAQHQAALAVDADGEITVVWSSRRQQEGRAGVYLQRFTPQGVAIGAETPAGLAGRTHQTEPAIAVDGTGHTWIVWQGYGQDGYAGSIIARRFDETLAGGPEVLVNESWHGHQSRPAVAGAPGGGAVVVWRTVSGPKAPAQLRARLLGPDGQPAGEEFRIGTKEQQWMGVASVAFAADGTFAVAFGVTDAAGRPAGIHLQRFSRSGARLGDELDISGERKRSQIEPVLAAGRDGYVLAWLDAESDGSDYGVLVRRLDAEGRPLGEPQIVNTTHTGPQNGAAVAVAPDGRFAVAWNSADDEETGVFARLFSATGAPLGDEFRINRHTAGKQTLAATVGTQRLVFGARGTLLCAWSGDAQLEDRSSANVSLLSPTPLDLAGAAQGVTAGMVPAGPVVARADGPGPHQPPTFDPRLVDDAEREIRRGDDFGFTGIVQTGWNPPDPHMAVGPNHLVGMTNGAIAFFTKDGTKTFQDAIEGPGGFWGGLGTTGFVFDPEVLYDELSGRFFAMATEGYVPGDRSYVLVAVSDDEDPNGTWHKYRLETTGLAGDLFDSPNIGVDAEAVYITGDGFGITSNYPVYIFDKASLLSGQPPAIQHALTLSTSTQSAGIPPVSFDDPPALYMIEHQESFWGNNAVRLIALTDPLGTPQFTTTTLSVPTYRSPENPPQLGTSERPETFDARFWSVAYRGGSLWATHHVGNTRVRARWYEIAMNGWPVSGELPTLVQSGELYPDSNLRTFFCAITVNAHGDAAITAARSSPDEYISMVTAYRLADDPLGTFREPVMQQVSTGPYMVTRWGDYGAVNADPAAASVFWAHHQYAQGDYWHTWLARVELPRLAGDLNCDGVVDNFDISPFVLALTNPEGYAEAYPDCDRLAADINGDGVVNNFDIAPFVALLTGK